MEKFKRMKSRNGIEWNEDLAKHGIRKHDGRYSIWYEFQEKWTMKY